jgi:hypothetical protein
LTYPASITTFTYQANQPTTPDVGSAENVNALHTEVAAIENTLGVTPFAGTPYTTLQAALFDLYFHKSPLNHTHQHELATNKDIGDNQHSLYAPVDGSIPYTGPVAGVAGTAGNNLVTLGQIQAPNYVTTTAVTAFATSLTTLTNYVTGFVTEDGGYATTGPAVGSVGSPYGWKITGALAGGTTDASGILNVNIPPGMFNNKIQSIKITKIPAPGEIANGYTWQTDSLTVINVTPKNFTVRYTPGPASDHVMTKYIYFTWLAMGA